MYRTCSPSKRSKSRSLVRIAAMSSVLTPRKGFTISWIPRFIQESCPVGNHVNGIRRQTLTATLGLGLLGLHGTLFALSGSTVEVGRFSRAQAGGTYPDSWNELTFKTIETHTEYSLVEDDNVVVLKAVSQGSASGLTRAVNIDPRTYPVVEWRWKIENVLKNGDVTRKDGDDYPARLYITFAYDGEAVGFFEQAQYEAARLIYGEYPPIAAVNYIWASKSPVGTMVPNPSTDRAQMIVIESGTEKTGQWVRESRNLYEDYQKAFGDDPPLISGVAVMTDTDDTQESAVAYYGDIVFKKSQDD